VFGFSGRKEGFVDRSDDVDDGRAVLFDDERVVDELPACCIDANLASKAAILLLTLHKIYIKKRDQINDFVL